MGVPAPRAMPRATAATVRARLRSLAECVERQGARPAGSGAPLGGASDESPEQGAVYVRELRFLADRMKAVEARHVSRGLMDPAFPFARAQEELSLVRDEFARLARALARGWSEAAVVAPAAALPKSEEGGPDGGGERSVRRELLDLAYLVKHAPLTDSGELEEIRRTRAARAARAEAPVV